MSKSKKEQVTAAVGSLQPKSVFSYGGVNWLVLGRTNGNTSGVMCLAENILFSKAFDDGNCNNWEDSSLREHLNNDFLEELVDSGAAEAAFVPMVTDLTADDGLKDYGTCEDLISLISCQQYRKYRGVIPNVDGWWWTCTAYSTKANDYSCGSRYVDSDGTLNYNGACRGGLGVRPLCTLQSDILVSFDEEQIKERTPSIGEMIARGLAEGLRDMFCGGNEENKTTAPAEQAEKGQSQEEANKRAQAVDKLAAEIERVNEDNRILRECLAHLKSALQKERAKHE